MSTAVSSIPIGFQLYTVRGEFARDVPGTIARVAKLGYAGVEFWGYAGTQNFYQTVSVAELRKMLDDNGLKCCGAHLEPAALAPENIERTIEASKILGSKYLTVAGASEKMTSEKTIAEFADFLNAAALKCRSPKLVAGYHAHPFDFARIGGRFAWELLFNKLMPEINMQMDVGNCLTGGGDPIAMLRMFPGRTHTIHLKEHEEKTFESDYFKEVFRICESGKLTAWYIVEMGGPDGNGYDVPRDALARLRKLGK